MTHAQQNWSAVPLVELLSTLETGGRPKGGVRDIADGIPSLGGEHLSYEGKFKFERLKFIPEEFANSLKSGKLSVDDVLVVKDGATTGKTVRVGKDFPFETAYVNEHVYLCRPSRNINSQYITYFLRSDEGQKAILDNFRGAAQGGITKAFAENVLVPVAPLNEQIRIADKLDSVLAKVDAAQARLEKIPTLLKRFRQSVLAAATSGELTDTEPEGKDSIGNTCEVIGGLTKNKQRESISQQLPYLRVANVYENELRLQDILKIGVFDKELERVVLRKDDLLIVEGNGSIDQVGRVALWDDSISPCVHQNHLIKVRVNSEILLPKYLLYYLMSPKGKEEIVGKATSGAGLYTLSISKISSIKVAIFTVEQQKEIVRRVESLFTLADTVEKQYLETKKRIDRLTQSLLTKAFRGELVPQDPNDEPAAELLKRIQAERNAQPPVKNKRAKSA
jgi:type I restriction enzyme S subunit